MYEKVYRILERCTKPVIFPNGGTYAGSVLVSVSSSIGADLHFTTDGSNPTDSSSMVPSNGLLTLEHSSTLKVVAMKSGQAPSSVASADFFIQPKVATPTIRPDATVFAISATITITCSTENATIYYTTDGSTPTLSSLTIDPANPQLVVDKPGQHQVTAFAAMATMLSSDVVSKTYTILQRAPSAVIRPAPGTYVSSVEVTFECSNTSGGLTQGEGTVFFTLDGKTTPSVASQHVACNQHFVLSGYGKYTIRAFVDVSGRSPSAIVESTFVVVRPPYDEFPVFPNTSLQRRPQVDIYVVGKSIPHTSYYQKGCVSTA